MNQNELKFCKSWILHDVFSASMFNFFDLGFPFFNYYNFMVQGVYYYFYQIFRNRAEAAALEQKSIGIGDGSVGMISSLTVAALSG